jgi:hypothetical protein
LLRSPSTISARRAYGERRKSAQSHVTDGLEIVLVLIFYLSQTVVWALTIDEETFMICVRLKQHHA